MPAKMVVTDLDGTVLQRDQRVSAVDLATLEDLGARGVLRVIATGRSLYSARKVLPGSFPVDYVVFSSGAGVVDWRSGALVRHRTLGRAEVEGAVELLKTLGLDFMVHRPVPENHRFVYYETGRDNPDFSRRLDIYREFSTRRDYGERYEEDACQIVVVAPSDAPAGGPAEGASGRPPNESPDCPGPANGAPRHSAPRLHADLSRRLAPLTVIRTTSPIDGHSIWIEVFPAGVSKASAAQWIADVEGVERKGILALGNDYNDLDLLEWAPSSYLVEGAPGELKRRFTAVGPLEENGFTEGIRRWLGAPRG